MDHPNASVPGNAKTQAALRKARNRSKEPDGA
jgi:hypothetical protein